jgi:hypothetical protein
MMLHLPQLSRVASAWIASASLTLGVGALWYATPVAAAPPQVTQLAASRTINGTVIGGDGKPAANMAVKLIGASAQGSGPAKRPPGASPTGDAQVGIPQADPLQKAPGSLEPGEKVVSTTTTDSNGKFTFPNVTPGPYSVMAGVGAKSNRQTVSVAADKDPEPVTIKLPR